MGKSIEIFLDDHNDEFVQGLIDRGEYKNASDVIGVGLFYLEEEVKHMDEPLTLTPKGCLEVALTDSGISDVDLFIEDEKCRNFNAAYLILERRMKSAGTSLMKKESPRTVRIRTSLLRSFPVQSKGFILR